mmetsp:Transcript_76306/g.235619  ORF Transcript_76306/g.235619 Transcript_76306/m.235619 type:complete len:323 (-) Transcript_76306:99-1067(-)
MLPCYKDAAETAIVEMEVTLPGQPTSPTGMWYSSELSGGGVGFQSMPAGHIARTKSQTMKTSATAFRTLSETVGPNLRTVDSLTPQSRGLEDGVNSLSASPKAMEDDRGLSSVSSRGFFPKSKSKEELDDQLPSRASNRGILVSSKSKEASEEGRKNSRGILVSRGREDDRPSTVQSRGILVSSKSKEVPDDSRRPPSRKSKEGAIYSVSFKPDHDDVPEKAIASSMPVSGSRLRTTSRSHSYDAPPNQLMLADSTSPGGSPKPVDQKTGKELGVCGICLEVPVNTELQPCSHRVACDSCASKLGVTCPLCQAVVREVKKLR